MFAYEPVWFEAVEGLQSTSKTVRVNEVLQVPSSLVMIIIVEALDGRVFDCPVHPFHLAICPRMVDLGQPVPGVVLLAGPIEMWRNAYLWRACSFTEAASGLVKPRSE